MYIMYNILCIYIYIYILCIIYYRIFVIYEYYVFHLATTLAAAKLLNPCLQIAACPKPMLSCFDALTASLLSSGVKIFLPFESPYMTSFLTSIGTFFLSRTVFEIFDFKVFRV